MKEKNYLILGISIILISIIGVTFAYFSTSILGDRKKVSVDMAELKIIFTNGDAIEATNVSAEDNLDIVKTFSVENKTKYDYEYNIVIEYFGLLGNISYDRNISFKKQFCAKNNIELIDLYPKDIDDLNEQDFTQYLLKKILKQNP